MFILTSSTVFLLYLSICSAGSTCPAVTFKKCTCNNNAFSTELSSTEISTTETSSTDKTSTEIASEGGFLNEINSTKDLTLGKLVNAYIPTKVDCPKEDEGIPFSDLESDLSQFQNLMIDNLTLNKVVPKANSKERSLKFSSSLFQGIRIRTIKIKKTRLSPGFISTGSPFENQIILTTLSVQDCDLTGPLTYDSCGTVLTKNLEKMRNLQTLDLSNNYITCVSSNAFSNPPPKLSTINLSTNDISYIFPGAFKKVIGLVSIDLSKNNIQFQPKDIFPSPATKLETIHLESNLIKSLPENFFSNMQVLKEVYLQNNRLHAMPENVWSGIWSKLTVLDVSGHIIECNCDLLWIVKSELKAGATITGKCNNYDDAPNEYDLKDLKKSQLSCSDS